MVDLYERFGTWCQRGGVTLTQQRLTFKRNLENLGFTMGRGNRGEKVIGLSLRP